MNKKTILAALVVSFFALNTYADTLEELQECAKTKDSLVRLVCYDNAVKSLNNNLLSQSLASLETDKAVLEVRATEPNFSNNKAVALRPVNAKPIVVQQTASKEDAFGKEHIKKSKEEISAISSVMLTVKSVSETLRKKKIITFENGQIWEQSDDSYIKLLTGDEVTLSKGMLGVVYLKKTTQNRKIKVKRKK